ncbi:MAG TPA: HTH domain-containing protein [Smithellaceae bacterium]|nr:HTH domain-containing protein [Smithellaceae bacterium]
MNQFLEYARKVLESAEKPLLYQEIWEKGKDLGYDKDIATKGKTPWQTLGAQLFVDVRDNPNSLFIKVAKRPARFFLKSKANTLTGEVLEDLDSEVAIPKIKEKEGFTEKDLHPLLAYFAYTNLQFSRGKAILTKTIYHEVSKKNGLSEWIHPDMVGVYIPIDDWNSEIIELNNISNSNAITLYSFELKKSIDRSNYREYFFQAVSNSSWANEGYLVAANIKDDDELLNELERLSTSFGIGIIELDLEDIDSSRVIFQAHRKKELDWETMNKLSDINKDFRKFIQDVKIDFDSKRIHKSEYDEIISNPVEYIKKIMKKIS